MCDTGFATKVLASPKLKMLYSFGEAQTFVDKLECNKQKCFGEAQPLHYVTNPE
jgi:hypothetical protein